MNRMVGPRFITLLLTLFIASCDGDGSSSDSVTDSPDSGDLQNAAREVLESARERGQIEGYALEIGAADEQLVRISAGDVEDPDTSVLIASAGKPVAAAVILSIVDDARATNPGDHLKLDEPIATYLEDPEGGGTEAAQKVTLRHLLNHISGLDTSPDCVGIGADEAGDDLMACAKTILEAGTDFVPGTKFDYGGGSYQVAGAVAEAFTGRDWQILVNERIAEPLGVSLPFLPTDNPRIGGGIFASAADLAAFQRAVLTRDTALLSGQSYDRFRESQTGTEGGRPPGVTASDYAFGFWIEASSELANAGTAGPELSSPGFFGTTPWLDEDRAYFGVLLLRQSDYDTSLELMSELRAEILARLP